MSPSRLPITVAMASWHLAFVQISNKQGQHFILSIYVFFCIIRHAFRGLSVYDVRCFLLLNIWHHQFKFFGLFVTVDGGFPVGCIFFGIFFVQIQMAHSVASERVEKYP